MSTTMFPGDQFYTEPRVQLVRCIGCGDSLPLEPDDPPEMAVVIITGHRCRP